MSRRGPLMPTTLLIPKNMDPSPGAFAFGDKAVDLAGAVPQQPLAPDRLPLKGLNHEQDPYSPRHC